MTSSTNFDPYSQNVTLLLSDGITPITFGVQDVEDWYSYAVKSRVNFATQVGACMVMFFATAFLTRESQRSKPVFILNLASLALGTLRPLLLILWATSPWSEFYSYFSGDISRVHKDTIATSVAATVIPVLMTITVNTSLVLQAQTVCKVMEKKYLLLDGDLQNASPIPWRSRRITPTSARSISPPVPWYARRFRSGSSP
jgi:pheromone alpha factor receptor